MAKDKWVVRGRRIDAPVDQYTPQKYEQKMPEKKAPAQPEQPAADEGGDAK